jgi:hypothetical protein
MEEVLAAIVIVESLLLIVVTKRNSRLSDDRFKVAQRKAELVAALSFYRDAWDTRGRMGERGERIKKARPSPELIEDGGLLAQEALARPLYPENGSGETRYEEEWIGTGVVPDSDDD